MIAQTISNPLIELFHTHGTRQKFEKGMHIFHEGERAEALFLIQSGIVQISKETENAKELTIRICSDGSIFGESLMFCKFNHYATTAKVLKGADLLVISNEMLEGYLTAQPSLMLDYVKWIQTENLKQQSRLRDLVLHGKKGALYSTLIRLANTYGEQIDDNKISINFSVTNTDIANLCATSREMINRLLTELRKQHIISIHKSYITILDLQYLKDEIACEGCPLAICRID